ncbi:MAG: DUF4124 domain-containing protein, partial [Gammaproteobacteria bacterium]
MGLTLDIARLKRALSIGVLITLPLVAGADIYKYVDEYGRVHLTDEPVHDGYKRMVKTWKGWAEAGIAYRSLEKNRLRHSPTIDLVAKRHRLPSALI